ncbi:MAG: thioredoxin domain-containing protein [Nannocystaceae bacterium]|nr:thioredoxin domain-containing protein [Nannocystaceae bacterium]
MWRGWTAFAVMSMHARSSLLTLSLLSVFGLGLPGCQGQSGFAQIQESLASIDQKQDNTLAKIDGLEQKLDALRAAGPGKAKPPAARAGRPDPKLTYKVAVGDAAVKGSAEALVTIVEWSDFQCPFCSKVNPTMAKIHEAYGDKVRVAFKHNPLPMHNRAMAAALAAEAAGRQGKFWEMHDKLFANGRALTDENFEKWASELQLDVAKFKTDLKDKALETKVRKQQSQGSVLGARGTPSFFVNGRHLSGAQPFEAFKALIDTELKKAEALVAKGTAKKDVYAKLIANGKAKV